MHLHKSQMERFSLIWDWFEQDPDVLPIVRAAAGRSRRLQTVQKNKLQSFKSQQTFSCQSLTLGDLFYHFVFFFLKIVSQPPLLVWNQWLLTWRSLNTRLAALLRTRVCFVCKQHP